MLYLAYMNIFFIIKREDKSKSKYSKNISNKVI